MKTNVIHSRCPFHPPAIFLAQAMTAARAAKTGRMPLHGCRLAKRSTAQNFIDLQRAFHPSSCSDLLWRLSALIRPMASAPLPQHCFQETDIYVLLKQGAYV